MAHKSVDSLSKKLENKTESNQSIKCEKDQNSIGYFPSSVNIIAAKESNDPKPNIGQMTQGDTDQFQNPPDLCCVSFFCGIHRRLALVPYHLNDKGLFLPYCFFTPDNYILGNMIQQLMDQLFDVPNVKFSNIELTKVDRIQLPKNETFISRYFFKVEVSNLKNTSNIQCICQTYHKIPISWLTYDEVCSGSIKIAGPEPIKTFDNFEINQSTIPQLTFQEFSVQDILQPFISNETTLTTKFFKCSGLNMLQIESILNEFIIHCYPSLEMSVWSFDTFLRKKMNVTNLSESMINKYFRSFKLRKEMKLSFLSFIELFQGLTIFAMKSSTRCDHLECSLARHEYMFRYYSSGPKNDLILRDDLCQFFIDECGKESNETVKKNISSLKISSIESKYKLCLNTNNGINLQDFLTMIRSEFPLKSFFIKSLELDLKWNSIYIDNLFKEQQAKVLGMAPILVARRTVGHEIRCDSCAYSKFYLSTHFISLTEFGEVRDINKLEADYNHIPLEEFKSDLCETDIYVLANDLVDRIKRFAMAIFSTEELVTDGTENNVANWFFAEKSETISFLKMIANKAEEIFTNEARLINIQSPCIIFGDIHGNLADLLGFAQNIWKTSPFVNQSKYLFLGDYVDRGSYGVEVVILLFCMKILAPNNFFLLRGNHEVREIQEQFSFHRECCTRFDSDVWEIINMTFDRLPLAAIVDGALYCAHGGIPASVNSIEPIRSIPSPLDNPIVQSPEAWEIFWNDPVSEEEFSKLSEFEQNFANESNGFARNTKRGTAYLFSEKATLQFLNCNKIDFILRGHEVYDEGYRLHQKGNVLTIFSCSKYVELNNRASVLFVNGHKIRIIQIATEVSIIE